MTQFLAAMGLFLALHSVPAIPAIRQRLIDRLGRRVYLALYSLASIISLGWVFQAALALDYVELWPPAPWQAWIALILAPLALVLLVAGLISPNPMSISFRRGDAKPGAIVAVTRHPVLWGFILWSGSHVIANGDLRSLMLFGSLGLFAALGMAMTERRSRRRLGVAWSNLAATTSVLPLAAILSGRARPGFDALMLTALLATALITAWLLWGGHAALFSADPLALAAL
ncbi:NnrU family protein [Devosia sp. XJ19-1]|uniref:NnrU family protein n=1 Tax=Devosia ureilytica TaxID=2952754 RepID=A0A9Q4AR20_9HYPH|nr:NnrU family protein [Devosia ureilytica]MCP8884484.1 NnrU family protein [Devosia ureilytica]MCP8888092.1 NnrU family protein [Devosia ureilytica]